MRANTVFFLSTAANGMSVLFIPVLAEQMGASDFMIGLIVAFYGLMSFLSYYLFGRLSDARGRIALIRLGLLFSGFAFALQVFVYDSLSLLVVRGLCGVRLGVFYSSLVIYGVERGKKVGKYTAFESLGWGFGNLLAGVVAVYYQVFVLSALFFFAGFMFSLRLREPSGERVMAPFFPWELIKRNLRIYLPFLLRDIGAFAIWAFLPIYMIELGASPFWVGLLYFLNTGSQFFMKQFVDDIRYGRLFRWGLVLSALAFYTYMLPTNYLHLIPVQLLVAVAWSALGTGAMGSLTVNNREKATVVGLFSSSRSLARIMGPFIAGILTSWGGFTALMTFSGSVTLGGFLVHLWLRRG